MLQERRKRISPRPCCCMLVCVEILPRLTSSPNESNKPLQSIVDKLMRRVTVQSLSPWLRKSAKEIEKYSRDSPSSFCLGMCIYKQECVKGFFSNLSYQSLLGRYEHSFLGLHTSTIYGKQQVTMLMISMKKQRKLSIGYISKIGLSPLLPQDLSLHRYLSLISKTKFLSFRMFRCITELKNIIYWYL